MSLLQSLKPENLSLHGGEELESTPLARPALIHQPTIEQWGYTCRTNQEAAALVWPVRFKPGVTVALVILGLTLRLPWLLIGVGALGILGTFFQSVSWIDVIYNHAVRKIAKTPALGPDPSTRRWLCGFADLFVLLSGLALAQKHGVLAASLSGVVILLAGSVVLTGICLPAYLLYKWKTSRVREQLRDVKKFTVICLGLLSLVGFVSQNLHATDGYFQPGYGIKSKGMGGAGVAYSQDALAPATNPAGISFVDDQVTVGLDYFRPIRKTSVTGNAGAANNIQYDASGKKDFFIPEFGYNKKVSSHINLGVAAYANGGMNTTYTRNITLFGTTNAGVDLSQAFVSPTISFEFLNRQSIGLALNLAYQRFKATGLQNFDNSVYSQSPGHVTDNGYDTSTGWGARLGWTGKITDKISLGATYQTKTKMGKFEKYKGLFAEQGGFDIPENYAVGISAEALPRLILAFDVERINYSGVKSVGTPLLPALGQTQLGSDDGAGFGWQNVTAEKIGISYGINDAWTVRAGYNHSGQPIPASETLFNLLAPGVVQDHVTLGTTWAVSKAYDVSLAYAHAFQKSVNGSNSIPAGFGGGEANLKMYQDSFGVAFGYHF